MKQKPAIAVGPPDGDGGFFLYTFAVRSEGLPREEGEAIAGLPELASSKECRHERG
jgi:hypothetical protein